MPQLTIRGVSDDLGRRLARVSRERKQSMNALALEILEQAVGTSARRRRLQRYATWTAEEAAAFDAALADQRVIDDDLWR
jgi:plasmid stability protein